MGTRACNGSVKKSTTKIAGKSQNGADAGAKVDLPKPPLNPRRSSHSGRPSAGRLAKARSVEQYEHPTKTRLNNPPVGLVTPETDPDLAPKTYAYDPHLDPQFVWAGKAEKTTLTVDTVSLHVHERIDPYTIIESVRNDESFVEQPSLFASPAENPPLREAVDFYKHQHDWSNRLIAGDSTLVMNSLLEREGMASQVQMIYLDPPYGIRYRSNFQPFVNQRDVGDKDEDLTQEPEMIRAFRDTWELGIHSYLTYLRDRLILSRELLTDRGSCFIQISDENLHRVRAIADEVFGAENFIAIINYITAAPRSSKMLENNCNYVIWYAKNKANATFRPIYRAKPALGDDQYKFLELSTGDRRQMTADERSGRVKLPAGSKIFTHSALTSTRSASANERFAIDFEGKTYPPGKTMWQTNREGIERLKTARRIFVVGSTPRYLRYLEDFPAFPIGTQWTDTSTSGFGSDKKYVVQTNPLIIERCMLMSSDPGDLVMDPTCGSGTTAVVAEQWGRRWITCDTSRVAITLAKQRLLTSVFDYYQLISQDEGVDGGFRYRMVSHIKLSTIANDEAVPQEPLFDEPLADPSKTRVTGPFTVEAVPAPMIAEMNSATQPSNADASVSRSGATQRQYDWRSELQKTGVRGLGDATIKFSRIEPLSGTRYLHADGETVEDKPRRVVISFGPEYQPLEQRQVEAAWEEARQLDPRPEIILFAAFQFDPEAAKDIDEMPAAVTKKTTFLKVQMNADLLTEDLKKKRSNNQSFWLVGRPDVGLELIPTGEDEGKFRATVRGFDYYNVKTGEIESGDSRRIAMWMLDPDYDGRSLFPRQIFFPNAGDKDGWNRLAKSLRAELDPDLLKHYFGTESLAFTPGQHRRVAVKIVDNRGIESLRVLDIR